MGPRPRGRGIASTFADGDVVYCLQWGRDRAVAEFGARGWRCLTRQTFNGAATARSRNYGGTAAGDTSLILQWGRDRAVAELPCVPFAPDAGLLPSMGPRPRGRGIITRCSVASPTRYSFNGAATARSRNFLGRFRIFGPIRPSMGPRPRGRGIGAPIDSVLIVLAPSMGPRPRGRGIATAAGFP